MNIDVFVISVCFGTIISQTKNVITLAFVIAGIQSIVPIVGFLLGKIIGSILERISYYIGSGIIIMVGIHLLLEASQNPARTLGEANLLRVYLGAGLDDLMSGGGIGTLGGNFLSFFVVHYIVSSILNAIALRIGK